MSKCTYAGKEYSEGSEICQEGRIQRCLGGKWGDTGRDCKEKESVGIGIREEILAEEKNTLPLQIEDKTLRDVTHYSNKDHMSWNHNKTKLYGRWSQSLTDICIDNGMGGYIEKITIDATTSRGKCSNGVEVIQVDHTV